MKLVEWEDEKGYKHLTWIKDSQSTDDVENGISNDPPDVERIDWQAIKRDLHNQMVEKRITSWADVQRHQNALGGILNGLIKKQLVYLFREGEVKND